MKSLFSSSGTGFMHMIASLEMAEGASHNGTH
jgi:hypothetical protein